jgi:hypothetical protein
MSSLLVPLALICATSLAGILLSCLVLLKIRSIGAAAAAEASRAFDTARTEIAALRQTVEALTSRLAEVEHGIEPVPAGVRPAFNVNKRSHVLRLHRRGDSPGQIAASLAMPRREVDLLLKVHQIVMKSL